MAIQAAITRLSHGVLACFRTKEQMQQSRTDWHHNDHTNSPRGFMALRFSTPFAHVIALSVLASSYVLSAHASSETNTKVFEPPLRELWTRGSERFQRQWLI